MVIDREQALRRLAEHEIGQLSGEQKLNLVLDYWYSFEDFDLAHELKSFLAGHEAESLTEYTDFFQPIVLIGLADKYKIFNNKYLAEELKRYTQNEFQVSGNEKQDLSPCPSCSFYSLSPPRQTTLSARSANGKTTAQPMGNAPPPTAARSTATGKASSATIQKARCKPNTFFKQLHLGKAT